MTTAASRLFVQRELLKFRSKISPNKNSQLAKYGGRQTVTALPGDGIGPEMIQHLERIFTFAHVPIDFEITPLSSKLESDEELYNSITAIKRNGVAIKGNVETKFDNPQFKSRNMELRSKLDLYANILHCITIPTIRSKHNDIDIIMIRENTEGEYSGLEHQTIPGVVESLKIVTKSKIERISRFAFEYALAHDRKNITAVHKANIQKLGDGLFLKIVTDMAKRDYPQICFKSMIVDNASMQLVSRPEQFNEGIMLMPNLYGNIISNIACGLVGGAGLVSGINIGDNYAVFETATRNTGTTLAGNNIANPTAFIRAGVDMLCYLGFNDYANLISDALFKTLTVDRIHTRDIGGDSSCSDIVDGVLRNIEESTKNKPKRH